MGKDGKYAYGTGRARRAHRRDRAQLEFEGMLIDEFLGAGEVADERRNEIPVRFGAQQLAEFLDDSAIAAALIRGELPEANPDAPPLTVGGLGGQGLDDLVAEARISPAVKPLRVATRRTSTPSPVEPTFTMGGVLRGFILGVGSAAALLLLARMLL